MAVAPGDRGLPASGSALRPSGLARAAVALAAVFGVALAVWAVGYSIGGDAFYDRNPWGTAMGVTAMLVGVVALIAAFVLAIVAKVRRERWALLWLPLCLLPVFFAFVVLGEAFWWE